MTTMSPSHWTTETQEVPARMTGLQQRVTHVRLPDGHLVLWPDPKTAAHLVHCVNEWDQLVAALSTVQPFLKDLMTRPRSSASAQRIGGDAEDSLRLVDAALAAAKEAP